MRKCAFYRYFDTGIDMPIIAPRRRAVKAAADKSEKASAVTAEALRPVPVARVGFEPTTFGL